MEEQQIQHFVHRLTRDEAFRNEFEHNPADVINREHVTPRVAHIIMKLFPHMQLAQANGLAPLTWWR